MNADRLKMERICRVDGETRAALRRLVLSLREEECAAVQARFRAELPKYKKEGTDYGSENYPIGSGERQAD